MHDPSVSWNTRPLGQDLFELTIVADGTSYLKILNALLPFCEGHESIHAAFVAPRLESLGKADSAGRTACTPYLKTATADPSRPWMDRSDRTSTYWLSIPLVLRLAQELGWECRSNTPKQTIQRALSRSVQRGETWLQQWGSPKKRLYRFGNFDSPEFKGKPRRSAHPFGRKE